MRYPVFNIGLSILLASFFSCQKNSAEEHVVEEHQEASYEMSVMSFNVRYLQGDVGTEHSWDKRKSGVFAMLNDKKPLIIGTQEGYESQIQDILTELPMYRAYCVSRDGKNSVNETNGILYLKDSIAVTYDRGTFWLSETPSSRSMGWDAACTRICSWMKLRVKSSGQEFYIFNTHLDHVGVTARKEGIKLIWSKIEELNTEALPVFLTGDFNTTIDDEIFSDSPYSSARLDAPVTDEYLSYNAFGKGSPSTIDHIFYSGMSPTVFETVVEGYNGITYISDHYPILCKFSYSVKR